MPSASELQRPCDTEEIPKVIIKVVVVKLPTHPAGKMGQIITQSAGTCITCEVKVSSEPSEIDMALNQFFRKLNEDCPKGGYQNLHKRPDHFTDGVRSHRVDMNLDVSYHWKIGDYSVLVSFTAGDDE